MLQSNCKSKVKVSTIKKIFLTIEIERLLLSIMSLTLIFFWASHPIRSLFFPRLRRLGLGKKRAYLPLVLTQLLEIEYAQVTNFLIRISLKLKFKEI